MLRGAIRTSDRLGIANFILRDAQHLAAVEVIEQAIVLSIMRFADELVDVSHRFAGRERRVAGARDGEGAREQPGGGMGPSRSPTSTASS